MSKMSISNTYHLGLILVTQYLSNPDPAIPKFQKGMSNELPLAYSNYFMTLNAPLADVSARYYVCLDDIPPTDIYLIAKRAEWQCFNAGLYAGARGNKIYFLSSGKDLPTKIVVDKYRFQLSDTLERLSPVKDKRVLETIFSWALKRRIFSLGHEGPDGQTYYESSPYKREFFDFHHGFECDAEVWPDGRLGVYLDPKIRWKQPLSTLVTWMRSQGYSEEEIKTSLGGRRVKCPTPNKNKDFTARISNVLFQDIGSYPWEHEGKKMSLYEYWGYRPTHAAWLARNHIQLHPSDRPVIIVEASFLPNGEKPYPPSVVELPVDLNDALIPEAAFQEKINAGPEERVKLTMGIFNKLKLTTPFSLGTAKVSFSPDLTNWADPTFKHVEVDSLNPPAIRFGDGFILEPGSSAKEPNFARALTNHGPITKKDKIPITMILPRQWANLVNPVQEWLIQTATDLHLGHFDFHDPIFFENPGPDDYLRACSLNGGRLADSIAIVVLPPVAEDKAYTKAKRGLGAQYISSQMLRNRTFTRVARWDGVADAMAVNSTLQNTAAQIYDKALAPGESIWQLDRPAGGLDPNARWFFMGFDVSRSYETKREAAAYAAVCDVYGRIITRKVLGSHKGERILANDLSDWIFDAGCAAYDASAAKEPIDGIMFFKDGPIRPNQLPEYEQGSTEARERLIGQKVMTGDSDIKVVSVTKRGPQRIYADPKGQRRVSPCAVYFGTTQAMGVTSNPRKGTPEVLRLSLDFQIKENMTIKQVYHIFNDLRYLDYSSLFMQPKTILPLHIVQNLAKLSKDDIEVPYVTR